MLLILGESGRLVLVGVGLGLMAAWAGARLLESLLFGVGRHDPLTFAGLTGLLCLTSLAASALPAWRAARIHPIRALREE